MKKAVCFTGHRPSKLPYKEGKSEYCKLKDIVAEIVSDLIEKEEVNKFICGMAEGADVFCGEIILMYRKVYPNIKLECAIPHPNQSEKWSDYSKARYDRIKNEADAITMISQSYTRDCMFHRNRYMVDNSSVLIAVYDGQSGGTKYTVDYAIKKGLRCIIINPKTFEISFAN